MPSGAVKNQKYRYCRTRRGRTLKEHSAKAATTHFSPTISVGPSSTPEIRHSERKSDIYEGAAISLTGRFTKDRRFVKVSLPILGDLARGPVNFGDGYGSEIMGGRRPQPSSALRRSGHAPRKGGRYKAAGD